MTEVPCLSCGSEAVCDPIDSSAQLSRSTETFRYVRCRDCDLIRLSPRPPVEALARWYDDYLLHADARAWGRYARFVERSFAAQDRARVRTVLCHQRLAGSSRVLDVGCGRPTFLAALARSTGAQCTGLDLSDAGWRDDPGDFAGLTLHAGAVAESRLGGPYDAITLWHALEHDPEPLASLRRLRAHAAPDALLVIEVPDAGGLTRRLQGSTWAGFHTPRHMAAFTPPTLSTLLERAGWRVDSLRRCGTLDPWVLWWLGRIGQDRSLSPDLEARFLPFVLGKLATWPLVALQRLIPLGVMTAIARPDG